MSIEQNILLYHASHLNLKNETEVENVATKGHWFLMVTETNFFQHVNLKQSILHVFFSVN